MSKRVGETSYRKTAFGIIPRSRLIPLEIEGIKRAWDFVLSKQERSRLIMTPPLVKTIHKIGFGWIFPEIGGKFRRIDVEVSGHRPPQFYKVAELMEDFCRNLKERLRHLPSITEPQYLDKLVELLSWAHHRFLWIHPFTDYNGRMARLLINIILLDLDLPPIELKVETPVGRRRYVRSLATADKGDETDLQKLIREALEETARELK